MKSGLTTQGGSPVSRAPPPWEHEAPIFAVCAPPPPWPCLFSLSFSIALPWCLRVSLTTRDSTTRHLLPTRSSNPVTYTNLYMSQLPPFQGPWACLLPSPHRTRRLWSQIPPQMSRPSLDDCCVHSIGYFNSCVCLMSSHTTTHTYPSAHLGISKTSPHLLAQPPARFPGITPTPTQAVPEGRVRCPTSSIRWDSSWDNWKKIPSLLSLTFPPPTKR